MPISNEQLKELASLAKSSTPTTTVMNERKSGLQKAGERTLGGVLKVLDFVEKPYYAAMNVGVDLFGGDEGFSPLKAIGRGFSGTEKSDFGDVLTEAGWQPQSMVGKITKGAVSFVGGVALDPITYLSFGAGKGLQMGGKVLSKEGMKEFFEQVTKATGKRIASVKDLKKLDDAGLAAYEKLSGKFWLKAIENPDAYFNKTSMRFMGREVPIATDAINGMGRTIAKPLKPLLNIEITRTSKRTGEKVTKTLGEIFDPLYGIKNSKNITETDKFKLIRMFEENRSKKAWKEMDIIEQTRQLFKGLPRQKREQVTYEVEKLLKVGQLEKTSTVTNRLMKRVQGKSAPMDIVAKAIHGDVDPFVLIEQGDYENAILLARWIKNNAKNDFDRRIVNSTWSEIRAAYAEKTFSEDRVVKMLNDIKDKDVKKVVGVFNDKMRAVWDAEVKSGARKKTKAINSGYVKRIIKKSMQTEDYNNGFFATREKGIKDIKTTKELYKEGKIDYMFETDAAKAYAARVTESNAMIMRKGLIDKLTNDFGHYFQKAGKNAPKGTVRTNLWGKNYDVVPELAREIKKIAPQLDDVGMKGFLKTYDKVQNFWKLSVTSLWPSFHSRNAVSNVYLGWLAGNNNMTTYKDALRLQWYGHKLKLGQAVDDAVIMVGGRPMKMSKIWEMGGETGVIGTGWFGGEFVEKLAINKSLKDPVDALDFYARFPRRVGTAVENNARIALFLDRLAKGDDAYSASMTVKKFLFDYSHLSETERKVFRRVVPFYTWIRKSIPLQLEQMVKQPGKYTALVHGQQAVEGMSQAQEEKYLPDWMRQEEMYVRLPNGKYFNPDLPFQDLAKLTLSDRIIREIVAPISPLIKGVFEIAANRDIFRDKPLANQNLPESKFAREKIKQEVLNNLRFKTIYDRATDEDKSLLDKFLDILFGLNVTPFDVQQGRKYYMQKQTQERNALRKLRLEKEK